MYNQHTRGMVTTRHRCLVGRYKRKTFIEDKGTPTKKKKMSGKTNIHKSKKKGFEHIQLPAQLIDHFLRSNIISINQNVMDVLAQLARNTGSFMRVNHKVLMTAATSNK